MMYVQHLFVHYFRQLYAYEGWRAIWDKLVFIRVFLLLDSNIFEKIPLKFKEPFDENDQKIRCNINGPITI